MLERSLNVPGGDFPVVRQPSAWKPVEYPALRLTYKHGTPVFLAVGKRQWLQVVYDWGRCHGLFSDNHCIRAIPDSVIT